MKVTLNAKILVANPNTILKHPRMLQELRRAQNRILPECELVVPRIIDGWTKDAALLQIVSGVEVIISANPPKEILEAAKQLRMIQVIGTGFAGNLAALSNRGIIVCNSVGMNAFAVAEHTMALILALAKGVIQFDRELRRSGWQKATKIPASLLRNKTIGIVGLGSIGVELAKQAKPFRMRIVAIKKHPSAKLKATLGIDFLGGPESLPQLLKESDFVVLSQTSSPETRKMIGENELRMMKSSAYLVNISRGETVDEQALIRVLKEKVIRGAALDVFEIEPTPEENPLLKMDNVVVTPHIADGIEPIENALRIGREEDVWLLEERAEFVMRNIERFLKGEKPLNLLN